MLKSEPMIRSIVAFAVYARRGVGTEQVMISSTEERKQREAISALVQSLDLRRVLRIALSAFVGLLIVC